MLVWLMGHSAYCIGCMAGEKLRRVAGVDLCLASGSRAAVITGDDCRIDILATVGVVTYPLDYFGIIVTLQCRVQVLRQEAAGHFEPL